MAFDPIQEDCLRLILENMRRERVMPLENPVYIGRCMDAFRQDPAQLIKTDRDRSFHLVSRAAEVTDYRIPFLADESEAERQEEIARGYLREAAELDSENWDAKRMLAELNADSNDAFVAFLLDGREELERKTSELAGDLRDPYSREYALDLAHRPYLRWLAALASRALIAGQYRLSLQTAELSLAYAPQDPADVRHTAMIAMAKLEYSAEEMTRFRRQHAQAYQSGNPLRRRHHLEDKHPDPWTLMAQLSAAYRRLDADQAARTLRTLVRSCTHAAEALYYQAEFPEGLFSRVNVQPGGEDELILAISESTPLLQEGLGAPENAGFACWISENDIVLSALEEQGSRSPEHAAHPRQNGDA